jgi:hypothetical protein
MSQAHAQPGPPPPEVGHVHPQRRAVLWGSRALGYAVYAYLIVTEIVLALGFVLLLFGANPEPAFVQAVYRSLDRAMEPFRGIFTSIQLGQTGNDVEAVLDTSVLFAMIVYGMFAWGVHAGLAWLSWRLVQLDALDREYRTGLRPRQGSTGPPGTGYAPRSSTPFPSPQPGSE